MNKIILISLTLTLSLIVACNSASQRESAPFSQIVLPIDSMRIAQAQKAFATEIPPQHRGPNPFSPSFLLYFTQNDSGLVVIKIAACDSCSKVELFSQNLPRGHYALDLRELAPRHAGLICTHFFITMNDTIHILQTRCF